MREKNYELAKAVKFLKPNPLILEKHHQVLLLSPLALRRLVQSRHKLMLISPLALCADPAVRAAGWLTLYRLGDTHPHTTTTAANSPNY